MPDCENCGNPTRDLVCPFCGEHQPLDRVTVRKHLWREVNIKAGKPTVAEAWDAFLSEVNRALMDGVQILVVVHGYGSSGKGGAIRREVRRRLVGWEQTGRVSAVTPGERFRMTRAWRKRFPSVVFRSPVEGNEGVTVVEL